jgi:hypothetical protein
VFTRSLRLRLFCDVRRGSLAPENPGRRFTLHKVIGSLFAAVVYRGKSGIGDSIFRYVAGGGV